MQELVEVRKGKVFCTSLMFSEKYEIEHKHILVRIRKLIVEYSTVEKEFSLEKFLGKNNQEYEMYVMTRKGFMFLVMNTGAKKEKMQKLYETQNQIIEAFDEMEKRLLNVELNNKNLEWKKAREQSKELRLETTDIIKDFTIYAKNQGSKNFDKYYKHYTNATYSALELMQFKKPKLRDTLDLIQLNQLSLAEVVCRKSIKIYMEQEIFYKDIYKLVKTDLENFAKALMIGVD